MILERKRIMELSDLIVPDHLKSSLKRLEYFEKERHYYQSAIREISTKLEILDDDFLVNNRYSPIHHMECRIKSMASILEKVDRKQLDIETKGLDALTDIAGIRVICNYLDDVYLIADKLISQRDITLIETRDYIKNPKPSGYRSLHLILSIPIFLAEGVRNVMVEIQIRTITMDTWASLEHELRYKTKNDLSDGAKKQLEEFAVELSRMDEIMKKIHQDN
ncbi:MAG: GTP pyrophosphokinase family protein [Erysipelotrichaceae bacterium]